MRRLKESRVSVMAAVRACKKMVRMMMAWMGFTSELPVYWLRTANIGFATHNQAHIWRSAHALQHDVAVIPKSEGEKVVDCGSQAKDGCPCKPRHWWSTVGQVMTVSR